jgi:hypothetical protein
MKAASSLPASWVSNPASAASTSRVNVCSSESTQRSRTGRSAGAGSASDGIQRAVRPYSAWNAAVFQ